VDTSGIFFLVRLLFFSCSRLVREHFDEHEHPWTRTLVKDYELIISSRTLLLVLFPVSLLDFQFVFSFNQFVNIIFSSHLLFSVQNYYFLVRNYVFLPRLYSSSSSGTSGMSTLVSSSSSDSERPAILTLFDIFSISSGTT